MLTWMIYAVSVSAVLCVAALVAEHSARHRRSSSRWFWLLAIIASLLIPAVMTFVSIQIPEAIRPAVSTNIITFHEITSTRLSPAIWIESRDGGSSAFQSARSIAKSLWIVTSALMSLLLLTSVISLYWRKRLWSFSLVFGVPVYISADVGPAVVGLFRPQIVLPIWILDSPQEQQAAVIAHEQSHIDARDPALLTLALCLITFMPWNLPLWWQLRRLRFAIEVDCDARVLKSGHKFAIYGETLIAVGERQSRYIGSMAGMSESKSFLERRLEIMLRKPIKQKLIIAVLLGCMSTALVTLAAQVSPPIMSESSSEHIQIKLAPEALDRYTGQYKFVDRSIMTVRREGDHLSTRLTGQDWLEHYPESESSFFAKKVKATISFEMNGNEKASALTLHQNGFDMRMPRVDAAEAEQIEADVAAKIKNQTATPGSEEALRRLIAGTMSGNPNYAEMSAPLAKATREQLPHLKDGLNAMGPVQSIQFVGVGNQGWDVYQVKYESGTSVWRIRLSSSGIIDGALVNSGP